MAAARSEARSGGPQEQVSALPRHKKIGPGLTNAILRGRIIAAERGTVPGILGLPPLKTWVYAVEAEDGSAQQLDVPEYNLVAWGG
jgi:hypothetical protein